MVVLNIPIDFGSSSRPCDAQKVRELRPMQPKQQQQILQGTPFRLFDLPSELRLVIYDYALADIVGLMSSTTFRKRGGKPAISLTPPLARASQRLRKGVLPVYIDGCCEKARKVVYCVHDFDFAWVTRFLQGLKPAQARALEANRGLEIKLIFSAELPTNTMTKSRGTFNRGLTRWLEVCGKDGRVRNIMQAGGYYPLSQHPGELAWRWYRDMMRLRQLQEAEYQKWARIVESIGDRVE